MTLKELQDVLEQYRLKPHYLEEDGQLYKLYTWDGVYALKKLGNDNGRAMNLYRTVMELERNQVHHAVPIIPTRDKGMFSTDGSYYYYLTPWIETKDLAARDTLADLFKASAVLHKRTTKEESFSAEDRKQLYEEAVKKIELREQRMEEFLEHCEKQIYLSPYELTYCLNYTELRKLDEVAKQKLEEWYEKTSDKSNQRVVLCHGNLRLEHLVYHHNHKPYLINFERSTISSPVTDLKYLIEHQFYRYPSSRKNMLVAMKTYERLNALTADERLMLGWSLLQMDLVESEISQYVRRTEKNEQKQVKRLQRIIWLKQNVSHFAYEWLGNRPASQESSTATST